MADPRPFTALDAPELEARIARELEQITAAVLLELGPACRALLLGGGYGRGEGGGRRDAAGRWQPLNDYDLVAVVRGFPRHRMPSLRSRLGALADRSGSDLGFEVELSALREEELSSIPFTMMWCELLASPRLLAGSPAALATLRPLPPSELPPIEANRYLANRGALLLWSRTGALPDERVWKFVAKAWLACGAAALIATGRFAVGYDARQSALEGLGETALPPLPELVERHRSALRERLEPSAPPLHLDDEVERAVAAVLATWRWCETLRLGWAAPSWEAYAGYRGLYPEPAMARPALLLRHLRTMGVAGLLPWRATAEHPRARLLRALPTLLAGEPSASAARLVRSTQEGAAARWLELWKRIQA